jgi:uncharacterized membrane protein
MAAKGRRALRPAVRRAVLVAHIVAGVAVIGDVWGLALMHLTALGADADTQRAAFTYTGAMVFGGGIPFSLLSLATGLVLWIWGGWGARRWWLWVKLGAQLAILATGGAFIAPILQRAPTEADPAGDHRRFLVLLAVQGTLLLVATVLAVYKPGNRLSRRRAGTPSTGASQSMV